MVDIRISLQLSFHIYALQSMHLCLSAASVLDSQVNRNTIRQSFRTVPIDLPCCSSARDRASLPLVLLIEEEEVAILAEADRRSASRNSARVRDREANRLRLIGVDEHALRARWGAVEGCEGEATATATARDCNWLQVSVCYAFVIYLRLGGTHGEEARIQWST